PQRPPVLPPSAVTKSPACPTPRKIREDASSPLPAASPSRSPAACSQSRPAPVRSRPPTPRSSRCRYTHLPTSSAPSRESEPLLSGFPPPLSPGKELRRSPGQDGRPEFHGSALSTSRR